MKFSDLKGYDTASPAFRLAKRHSDAERAERQRKEQEIADLRKERDFYKAEYDKLMLAMGVITQLNKGMV